MEYNKIITEIYEKCPCFESSSFTLRFVSFDLDVLSSEVTMHTMRFVVDVNN